MTRTPRRHRPADVTALGGGRVGEAKFGALDASGAISGRDGTWEAVWARTITERQFQAVVRGALERRGWVCWVVPNMKLTTAGLPDILAWHPDRPGLVLAWELKRERDYRVTPKQQAALAHLETVAGVEARIVRPSDWPALLDWLDAAVPPEARAAGGE